MAFGEHLTVGIVRASTPVKQHLRKAFVGRDEEAYQKPKSCCWHEVCGSKAGEDAGQTQLASVLGGDWGFGRRRRNPERGSQSAVWEVRLLGLDGEVDAHPICFFLTLSLRRRWV